MNIEFHYWITGLIAEFAGFQGEECQIIAYSSQYVDDNDAEILVHDGEFDPIPSYANHVSQTMNILLPKKEIMKIYPLFHFIPGDHDKAAKRKDGKTHILNTTADSSHASKIMQYSLQNAASKYKAGDKSGLYRIGVSTHAYADTWAHQNFVGWYDEFNAMGSNMIPDIGHADAMHHPDWVSHRWTDDRLADGDINNILRYIAAARKIYEHYTWFQNGIGKSPENRWSELESLLLGVFGFSYSGDAEKNREERTAQYRANAPSLTGYDENEWLSSALDKKTVQKIDTDEFVEKYIWKDTKRKAETDWYKFQEAVKEHMVSAASILQPVFSQTGITV